MKQQAFMEKLLDGVEVEWKPLGDVAKKISSGGTPKTSNKEYYDGQIPWLRTQEVNFSEIWDTKIKITEDGLNNSSARLIPKNCVIIAMYGATVGRVGINKISMATNQACANIELDSKILNYRYLYHYIYSKYEYIKSLGSGSQTNINAHIVKSLLVPIPPLSVQKEIVRILDAFTALTNELTNELTMRQQQYNHYRDTLLDFSDKDVEWKMLGEVTLSTNNINWKNNIHSYQYIDLTSVCRESNEIIDTIKINSSTAPSRAKKLVNEDDVIFATTRPTQLRAAIIQEKFSGTIVSTGYCVLRADSEKVLPRWIYHNLFTTQFRNYVEENESGSAYPSISDAKVKDYKIPIPSLEEQARIVAILDKFDTLTNSISEGLPREIELRQKQYTYYRDLLLNFPKPDSLAL